jgi:hypothetical protein
MEKNSALWDIFSKGKKSRIILAGVYEKSELGKKTHGSFSDNFHNCDGKYCKYVLLILQKNNKLK